MVRSPFVGQTGAMVHRMIAEAIPEGARIAFTNAVACVSVDDDHQHAPPPDAAVLACRPRLREFIELSKPKLIIAVGNVANDNLRAMKEQRHIAEAIPIVRITHPSHIARQNAYLYAVAVRVIREAVTEHLTSSES